MDDLIISVAVNGAELSREDTPHVPLTPAEIAASAVEAHQAGASIAHVHVRDENGEPSSSPELYAEVMRLVRKQSDVLLNFSTDLRQDDCDACLALGPEIASLPAGSVNLGDALMAAPRPVVLDVARRMAAAGVLAELELFHEGMFATAKSLQSLGILSAPIFCQFCLGFDGGALADTATLARMISLTTNGWVWGLAVESDDGLGLLTSAIESGGHVRVGFEDSPYFAPGQLAQSNADLVTRIVRIAGELGRNVADVEQTRKILHLYAKKATTDEAAL